MTKILSRQKISVRFIDTSDIGLIKEAIRPETKAIFVETPTNPLLKITNLEDVAQIADQHALLFIVDNTFSTPYWQKPITNGAHIVVHSATKYLGGHSDVVAGLVVVHNQKLAEEMHFIQNSTGGVLAPNDSWSLIRGIRTLGVRMEEIESNTKAVASFLKKHPKVEKVFYPGLSNHPNQSVHRQQCAGFGGMISFTVNDEAMALHVLNQLRYFTLAESLGAVESLVSLQPK